MFKSEKMKIKGRVGVRVFDVNGDLQRYPKHWFWSLFSEDVQNWARRVLKVPVGVMEVFNHNIVTDEGDAMIADLMAETPARTKVDNTNGHIEVGTGFVSEIKTRTSCTTPTGSPEIMDASYPQLKGAWGAADDNVTQYRSTFEAGDLNDTGIDEAALLNNAVAGSADCLAYAEISPSVNVGTSDTLQVDWELTFTGS